MSLPKSNESLFALIYFVHNQLVRLVFFQLKSLEQLDLHFVDIQSQICILIFKLVHQIYHMPFSKGDIEGLDQTHSLLRCQPRDVLGSSQQVHLVRVLFVNICCDPNLLWYLLCQKKTLLLICFGLAYNLSLCLQLELQH